MTPSRFDLPVNPAEAGALCSVVLEQAAGKKLTDDLRQRIAGRVNALGLTSIEPYFGSLEADPIHAGAFYLAVDGRGAEPLLLRLSTAATPASGLFPKSILIGRMRDARGGEIVVNAIPFSSRDREAIATYVERVAPAFLPRPQGSLPAIATGNRHPEISLPAAFAAFRSVLKNRRLNIASTVQLSATREMTVDDAIAARDGENPTQAGHTRVSIRHLYHAGLWAAVRAGWREGYTAEADHVIITGNTPDEIARSIEAGKEALLHAAGYTKFTTDSSRMFVLEADLRHPAPWSDSVVEEKFDSIFSAGERSWILSEFGKPLPAGDREYRLSRTEVFRLAVKFGESLKLNEDLYDYIKQVKQGRPFDFEPSIDEAETLTTAEEMIFYMHWLKARGRAAQLVPPNLGFKKRQAYPDTAAALHDYVHHKMWPELEPRVRGEFGGDPLRELEQRVRDLAAVARQYQGTLSIHSGSGKQAEVLQLIGAATGGRLNYKISGELQLQLFDVLYEQPAGSPWRALYDRMVERCEEFASRGAFGYESELAAKYREMGKGSYLGDAARGRVDGNLFLVFWLGNLVGTRDAKAPDGDTRFFKEKIDELPAGLLTEVRERNSRYIGWLAGNLWS